MLNKAIFGVIAGSYPVVPLVSVTQRIEIRALVLPGASSIESFESQIQNGSNTFTVPTQTVPAGLFIGAAHWYLNAVSGPAASVGAAGDLSALSPTASSGVTVNGLRTGAGSYVLGTAGSAGGALVRADDTSPPHTQLGQTLSFYAPGGSSVSSAGSAESSSSLSKTLTLPSLSAGNFLVVLALTRVRLPKIPAGWARAHWIRFATGDALEYQYLSVYTRVAEAGDTSVTIDMSGGGGG